MNKAVWIMVAVLALWFLAKSFLLKDSEEAVLESLNRDAIVIDVRTPEEFEGGHYDGATNIPLSELSTRMEEIGEKDRPVVFYCASGSRSSAAKRMLLKAGFTDVLNGGSLYQMPKK